MACGLCRATLAELCRQSDDPLLCRLYEAVEEGEIPEAEALERVARHATADQIRAAVRALVEEAMQEAGTRPWPARASPSASAAPTPSPPAAQAADRSG